MLRVYLRRSLDGDAQAESLATQRGACQRFAEGRGLPWGARAEYSDEGVSGDDFERPGLTRLLAEARPGDVVLAYDDSRLGRDALLTALVVRRLVRESGARVYYAATGAEATAEDGTADLVNVARGLGAEGELRKIRLRTREGLRHRLETKHWPNAAPYGYRLVPDPATATADGKMMKCLRPHPEEATVVLRIATLYLDGAGTRAISDALNPAKDAAGKPIPGTGTRGPGGRWWQPETVHDMLRRPVYRGVVKSGERSDGGPAADGYTGHWPEVQIIPTEMGEAIDRAIAARTKVRPRHAVHPLSG